MKQDFTRNIVIITGWLALLVIMVYVVVKFANEQLAVTLISFFTGSLGTALGFIFHERSKVNQPTSPAPSTLPIPPVPATPPKQ